MKTQRKEKLKTAKTLLESGHRSVLDCLTKKELDTLKQHQFKPDTFLRTNTATVLTRNEEASRAVDAITQKLDKYAKQNNFTEHIIIHLSKYHSNT